MLRGRRLRRKRTRAARMQPHLEPTSSWVRSRCSTTRPQDRRGGAAGYKTGTSARSQAGARVHRESRVSEGLGQDESTRKLRSRAWRTPSLHSVVLPIPAPPRKRAAAGKSSAASRKTSRTMSSSSLPHDVARVRQPHRTILRQLQSFPSGASPDTRRHFPWCRASCRASISGCRPLAHSPRERRCEPDSRRGCVVVVSGSALRSASQLAVKSRR